MKLADEKVKNCKCQICKSMCRKAPCLGTPEDIQKIIDAGYRDRLTLALFRDKTYGFKNGINLIGPLIKTQDGSCTFLTAEGLCELHDSGLKPTLGKLAYHTDADSPSDVKNSIDRHIEIERAWLTPEGYMLLIEFIL